MSSALVWPIVCLAIGLTLVLAEGLVPSGGLIGFLAFGMLGISLWQAFAISTTTGAVFVGLILLLAPLVFALALYLFPKTPLGRMLMLGPPRREDIEPDPVGPPLEHLIGQFGRTLTPLRPSGLVDFEGRRLDGLAEEGLIPPGTLVRAVQVRGRQLVVRVGSVAGLEDLEKT